MLQQFKHILLILYQTALDDWNGTYRNIYININNESKILVCEAAQHDA